MTDQLKEMGMRMRDLREIMDYTALEVAERLGISEEEYLAYEAGEAMGQTVQGLVPQQL